MSFYLISIFGILLFLLQDCLPFGSVDFTASAALQGICSSTLQLYALRLAYAANSTLAKFRCYDFMKLPQHRLRDQMAKGLPTSGGLKFLSLFEFIPRCPGRRDLRYASTSSGELKNPAAPLKRDLHFVPTSWMQGILDCKEFYQFFYSLANPAVLQAESSLRYGKLRGMRSLCSSNLKDYKAPDLYRYLQPGSFDFEAYFSYSSVLFSNLVRALIAEVLI